MGAELRKKQQFTILEMNNKNRVIIKNYTKKVLNLTLYDQKSY